jgi:hypothetical protein
MNRTKRKGLSVAVFALPSQNRLPIYNNTISLKGLRIAAHHHAWHKMLFRIPALPV